MIAYFKKQSEKLSYLFKQMISKLNTTLIQNICAEQVITDFTSCLKQLVENSLDAQSKTIKILLDEFGKNRIEVIDDGIGISKQQLLNIAQKGNTSKIMNFDDIQKLMSLGFRGEALNSISHLSDLQIISKHRDGDIGYSYDTRTKQLKEKQTEKGTKIIITKLFYNIPVRSKYFHENHKQYLVKVLQMIKQYSIIYLETKFILINTNQNKNELIFDSGIFNNPTSEQNWLRRIDIALGNKVSINLTYFNEKLFEGWVSNIILSGSAKQNWIRRNILYCYVNRRPIDFLRQFIVVLDQIYKQFNNDSKYVCIINLKLEKNTYDINLSPNKRQLYINNLKEVVGKIKEKIFSITEINRSKIKTLEDFIKVETKEPKESKQPNKNGRNSLTTQSTNKTQNFKRSSNIIDKLNEAITKKSRDSIQIQPKKANNNVQIKYNSRQYTKSSENGQKFDEEIRSIQTQKRVQVNDSEKYDRITLKNKQNINQHLHDQNDQRDKEHQHNNFKKQQFQEIQIIGQFNLGFIAGILNGYFYLIDQHAADQKFNYEKLLQIPYRKLETNLSSKLNYSQYVKIQQYKAELTQFGFIFELSYQKYINEQTEYMITFLSFPIVLDIVLGKDQFFSIVEQLGHINIKKYNPVIKEAASRACRMSTMIGDRLNLKRMRQILKNLKNLQSPWNCPHGRPTLIKTQKIEQLAQKIKYKKRYEI